MSPRLCLILAASFGLLAVILAAFGAHGLKDTGYLERKYASEPDKNIAGQPVNAAFKYLTDFETGVTYHMAHALAMGLTGAIMVHRNSRWLRAAAYGFAAGIVLFSGALYVLVIGGPRFLEIPWGMVAPLGGTSLMIGWLCLAVGVARTDYNRS
jgi:uncharacterized membrane protein YgdD (TMEM256/DUF423 family)